MAWLDAVFGRLRRDNVEFPIPAGINFTDGIDASQNFSTKIVDVTLRDAALSPAKLAPVTGGVAVSYVVDVVIPATGASGTLRDVAVWATSAPVGAGRIRRAELRVSTAFATGKAALRTASGGGGSVVLPAVSDSTMTFDVGATGLKTDNAAAVHSFAALSDLYLRLDRSVVGRLFLTCEAE